MDDDGSPPADSPAARALGALAGADIDMAGFSNRQRRHVAQRLRDVVAELPALDGPNRAAMRDLLALADLLERENP
jgi:hypothetical protein